MKQLSSFILLAMVLLSCEALDHTNPNDPLFVPDPPSGINTEVLSDSEIRITWIDGSDHETGYRMERDSGLGFTQIAAVDANVTTYTDSSLNYGTFYTYRIAAYTGDNTSNWSTSTATITIFPAPSDLIATVINDSYIELTWKDNCDFEVGFRLERDSGLGFEQIAVVGANETSYADSILDYFTDYNYRIGAITSTNISNYSPNATTLILGTFVDYDGNTYSTVLIGNQIWMAENLEVTHFRDGTVIPNITNDGDWDGLTSSAYCYYSNNLGSWGALYNWFAVNDSHNIAPEGWHVPTDTEWRTLYLYANNNGQAGAEGTALKSTTGWNSPGNGTDNFGFNGLPGGLRRSNDGGGFNWAGNRGYFWSATEYTSGSSGVGWYWHLSHDNSDISRKYGSKRYGFSIRLLRNR